MRRKREEERRGGISALCKIVLARSTNFTILVLDHINVVSDVTEDGKGRMGQ